MSCDANFMTGAKRLYLLGTIKTTAPLHIGLGTQIGVLPHETDQTRRISLCCWIGKGSLTSQGQAYLE